MGMILTAVLLLLAALAGAFGFALDVVAAKGAFFILLVLALVVLGGTLWAHREAPDQIRR